MKIILISFLALFLSNCLPEHSKNGQADFVRVEIAGNILKIPKGYFDGRSPAGKDTESVVLGYSLPNFKVLPAHPKFREERQKLINEGRKRGMLLEAAYKKAPLQDIVDRDIQWGNMVKQDNLVYGLEKYIEYPVHPDPVENKDHLLVERNDDGTVESYLRCSPPGKDRIPGCRHMFIWGGMLFNTHWRIQELQNWRVQQAAAIQFIKSMKMNER